MYSEFRILKDASSTRVGKNHTDDDNDGDNTPYPLDDCFCSFVKKHD